MVTRVALVSCVKQKRYTSAPARDLYLSPLFRGFRRYAESRADSWYILSAEHGVLCPEQVVEPYEQTLHAMPKRERVLWGERVREQLLYLLPSDAEIVLLAGMRYRAEIEPFLRERYSVSVPMEGLRIGEQLRWLREHGGASRGLHDHLDGLANRVLSDAQNLGRFSRLHVFGQLSHRFIAFQRRNRAPF